METHVKLQGHSRIDFRASGVRKSMRKAGRVVTKEARRLVSRRAISGPGEYPGRDSGELRRSIEAKVSRSGFLVNIRHKKTAAMDAFYPAFLHYGSKENNLEPRGNYIVDALERRDREVRGIVLDGLAGSLVPRK